MQKRYVGAMAIKIDNTKITNNFIFLVFILLTSNMVFISNHLSTTDSNNSCASDFEKPVNMIAYCFSKFSFD